MSGEPVHIDRTGQAVHSQRPGSMVGAVPAQRADARRNRAAILSAAWVLFEQGGETSMAAVARRAGVGMATLYRNFPGRRELLEAVYADEVAAVCDAAREAADGAASPGAALRAWLVRFAAFINDQTRSVRGNPGAGRRRGLPRCGSRGDPGCQSTPAGGCAARR